MVAVVVVVVDDEDDVIAVVVLLNDLVSPKRQFIAFVNFLFWKVF